MHSTRNNEDRMYISVRIKKFSKNLLRCGNDKKKLHAHLFTKTSKSINWYLRELTWVRSSFCLCFASNMSLPNLLECT